MNRKIILSILALLVALGIGAVALGVTPPYDLADDNCTTCCVTPTTNAAQYTLPEKGVWYTLQAKGVDVAILCGSNPTADATALSGKAFWVLDGQQLWLRLTGAKCSYDALTTVSGAELCFIRQARSGT